MMHTVRATSYRKVDAALARARPPASSDAPLPPMVLSLKRIFVLPAILGNSRTNFVREQEKDKVARGK